MREMDLADELLLHRLLCTNSRELSRLWPFGPEILAATRSGDLHELGIKRPLASEILSRGDIERQVRSDLAWLEKHDVQVLTIAEALYPQILKEIADPPPLLFLSGDRGLLADFKVAVVGSRRSSNLGRRTARQFAADLSRVGLTVVSGMATGIDGEAHKGALDAGGRTIAVLGTGIDVVYPAGHRRLARRIEADGLILSEFPVGARGHRVNFPRRNRVISGLCLGAVVVEAAERSGSLITARLAMEQGREVFAVPGSIFNPQARGCHQLIKQGAKLTENVEDVLEELESASDYERPAMADETGSPAPRADISVLQRRIVGVLGADPCNVDQIVELTGLAPADVTSQLVLLELGEVVMTDRGGYVLHPAFVS